MTAALALPLFTAIDSGNSLLIALALTAAFTLSHGAMYAPQAAFMSELFHPRVRYSGASLGAQLASVFAGGLGPFIGTALVSAGYGRGAVTLYVVGLAVVTLVAIDFGAILGGAIITENVFAWSGMGTLLRKAVITDIDPNLAMGILMVTAMCVIVFNILADIAYAYLDPRIRLD